MDLDYIFGDDSSGETVEDRARSSSIFYSRSQDHLAYAKKTSRGKIINAYEALCAYGVDALLEVAEKGSAILVSSSAEPARTLKSRRKSLGVSLQAVSRAVKLSVSDLLDCEDARTRSPIRKVQKYAAVLGLDERIISVAEGAGGDVELAARLKQLGGSASFSESVVLKVSQAAWVIGTQHRLSRLLNVEGDLLNDFKPDDDYGGRRSPAWSKGYSLAARAREIIGLSNEDPIPSIRHVCEKLKIPLINVALPRNFAGATVANGVLRGIVVNTEGFNENVLVRRATIAHELGHVLWDSDRNVENVRVDEYSNIDTDRVHRSVDPVESRANAFAAAFLAPPDAVLKRYGRGGVDTSVIRDMMDFFGVSYSVATQHLKNVLDLPETPAFSVNKQSSPEWRARESYTDDYFPIESTSSLRRGEFSGLVVRARKAGVISVDTASEYLMADPAVYREKEAFIESLY